MIGSIDHFHFVHFHFVHFHFVHFPFVDQQISVWQEERRIAERNGIDAHTQRPMIHAFRFRFGSFG